MTTDCQNRFDEPRATPQNAPPGRYLLRGYNVFDDPFEAEILEWSGGGRVKVRYSSGHASWEEDSDIPFLVEPLPAGPQDTSHD
jgi:hypothetical protein